MEVSDCAKHGAEASEDEVAKIHEQHAQIDVPVFVAPKQQPRQLSVVVIGAGWYGCHIGRSLLKQGCKVSVLEADNRVFAGASGFNQFRLHLGLHYPRSYSTRVQTLPSFERFVHEYPGLSLEIPLNVYAVSSKKSSLDFGTYMQVMRASHIPVNNIDPAEVGLVRVDGAVTCAERALLVDAPRAFFMEELKGALKLNCRVRKIEQAQLAYEASPRVRVDEKEYDWCINCTHNQNFVMTDLDVFYEPCLLLIYRDKRPEELRKRLMAITIMDGPLPSLYPYVLDLESFQANPDERLYTLSHVRYTPLGQFNTFAEAEAFMKEQQQNSERLIKEKRPLFEKGMTEFYPTFVRDFEYRSFFIAMKTKIREASANRSCIVRKEGRVIHIMSGKINTIFEAEDHVLDILGIKPLHKF